MILKRIKNTMQTINNTNFKYVFKNQSYDLPTINPKVLTIWLRDFIKDLEFNLKKHKNFKKYNEQQNPEDLKLQDQERYIALITQIQFKDQSVISLGNRQALDLKTSEFQDYVTYLNIKFKLLDSTYQSRVPIKIVFNYTYIPLDSYLRMRELDKLTTDVFIENELVMPTPILIGDTNYEGWGEKVTKIHRLTNKIDKLFLTDITNEDKDAYMITTSMYNNKNLVNICSSTSKTILEFTDQILNNREFIREIKNKIYYYKDNKVQFYFQDKIGTTFIPKAKENVKFNFNILTIDIETYLDCNQEMKIYCISMFDGKKPTSFYLTDYINQEDMVINFFKALLIRKNNSKTIYIHNSSSFDLIFLLKYLVNYSNIKIDLILKDGKFINIQVSYSTVKATENKKVMVKEIEPHDSLIKNGNSFKYNIKFRDSLLMLPSSLDKLGKAFKVQQLKSIFPYNFVTEDNLNYIGEVPEYKYFNTTKINEEEYIKNKTSLPSNWDLKAETIKYCEDDCKCLYQVIESFANFIYKEYKINLDKSHTLPSLAFRIFRTHYMKNYQVPVLTGNIFNDLSKSYYGGHVDMYIPSNSEGENIYHYDVNSLYPAAMINYLYPTKNIRYFVGDITQFDRFKDQLKDSLGILFVKIYAPESIKHPLLPYKLNNTVIYGVGEWTGWYTGEELKNAEKYGYTYEIKAGYLFEGEKLFDKYVEDLYKIKSNSTKDDPMYLISKLLMNSLYGRFGMKDVLPKHKLISNVDLSNTINDIKIENIDSTLELGDKTLISYLDINDLNKKNRSKINMAVASFVTSYSRILMAKYKNREDFELFYSDTDSIFINKPLAEDEIDGKVLGKMKLENIYKKFVALGAKVYGGLTIDGKKIIKIKGFKNSKDLTLDELEKLLVENTNIALTQQKWYRKINDNKIIIKDELYHLKPNNNKRELVYTEVGKFKNLIGTTNKIIPNKLTDKITEE